MGFLFIILVTVLIFSCSQASGDAEATGRRFLELLQQDNFAEAAEYAEVQTGGIVLFMEKMLEAAKSEGRNLDLPVPAKDVGIELLQEIEMDGYVLLEYAIGDERIVLHAIAMDDSWRIRLPRSSW